MCTMVDTIKQVRHEHAETIHVAVATTSQALIPFDPKRTTLMIHNFSGLTIFLSLRPMSVSNDGIRIGNGGEMFSFHVNTHGAFVHGPIHVMADAAGTMRYTQSTRIDNP